MRKPDEETSHPAGEGVQRKYKFKNGYGASVVRLFIPTPYGLYGGSHGSESGLWELAVLGPDGDLCDDTPITDNAIGPLDDDAVDEILGKIEALPAKQ